MHKRLLYFCFIAGSIFAAGCATKRVAFAAIQCPSDKSLVYVYWSGHGTSEDRLAIDVHGEHKALIHAHGYYPLVMEPGPVELGYSLQVNPIVPVRVANTNALNLQLQPGKTYYVAYRPWSGWKPKLVLMSSDSGQHEISGCTPGKNWQ